MLRPRRAGSPKALGSFWQIMALLPWPEAGASPRRHPAHTKCFPQGRDLGRARSRPPPCDPSPGSTLSRRTAFAGQPRGFTKRISKE
ncbi:hypothetical protein GCM10010116_15240 [Microbispora rosea subsp. aerata]|nr:hypothetical protein GCM10010116_15240 [Microbispora rosea subsp. aerata]